MSKQKILIVDDEKPTRDAMARALGRTYECLTAPDAELAMQAVAANPDLALVITDYKMPGDNGVTLIKKAKAANPSLGAILITAFGEIELAVEAMKEGADDFLTKPITDLDQLEVRVAQAIKSPSPIPTNNQQPAGNRQLATGNQTFLSFTGSSPAMERLYALIRKVAPSNANVLVEGPSGTGKELVARALHELSPRAKGPFIAVECSALSKDLLESELFGYAPGSFTGGLKEGKAGCFEAAHGGTLFLDEIGEIDLGTQVKLLRALESRTITRIGSTETVPTDFRLVSATNKKLAQLVVEGKFREDLYYRLNVIGLTTPPLKDRPGDIALLVKRFLKEFAKSYNSAVSGIEPDALRALEAYDWPGNVRQLRNVVERMVVLSAGDKLTAADLPDEITTNDELRMTNEGRVAPLNKEEANSAIRSSSFVIHNSPQTPPVSALAETEKDQILAALEACRGNKSKAAEMLGISRRTIHRKLNEWKIS